jgi:hypothetical protein
VIFGATVYLSRQSADLTAFWHGCQKRESAGVKIYCVMKTSLKFRSCSKRAKLVVYPIVGLAAINFFAFVFASVYLGGDALNGHIAAGHYFLCMHGHCTEVSSSIWHYSYWHAASAIDGFLLVFDVTALFLNTGDIEFE